MFRRLGNFVSRHWLLVVLVWLAAVVALRWLAPSWDEITRDGDLAYLPSRMPSIVGQQLLSRAFPFDRAKSQIAVFLARELGLNPNRWFGHVEKVALHEVGLEGAEAHAAEPNLEDVFSVYKFEDGKFHADVALVVVERDRRLVLERPHAPLADVQKFVRG